MKMKASQIGIGIVCFVMAFAITLQIKSVKWSAANQSDMSQRISTLQEELKAEKEKSEALYQTVIQYKDELETFKQEAAQSSDVSKALAKQLERLELLAGVSEVEGPGIVITLKDAAKAANNDDIVHDMDLFSIINELRAAGAEAISINGDRVVNTTEIRCVGPVVSVNGNRHASPFEICAIGDATTLESAVNFPGGPLEMMRLYNIEITVKKMNKVKIGAYTGNINFQHATPAVKED